MRMFDTCSLLLGIDELKNSNEIIKVSSITLQELEHIKSSNHKDESVKSAARKVLRFFNTHSHRYEIILYTKKIEAIVEECPFEVNNDLKIIASCPPECTFVTNDLAAKLIAKEYFNLKVDSVAEEKQKDYYSGYLEIIPSEEELVSLYENMDINIFNALTNQYVILFNTEGIMLDILCWTGKEYRHLDFCSFDSTWFGSVRPVSKDYYQMCLFDSLKNNDITLVGGPAGSGKTFIALAYLFSLLDKHKIDRIVIFCNPVAAKNAAKLGFYPGTVFEKLASSQVGAVLSSKLGGMSAVERLVAEEKLILLPMADARGYQVPDHSGVYCLEAQNLDKELLKLLLQRISEGSKVIIDGDRKTQLDLEVYAKDNGMERMSEVFRGEKMFGQVDLQKIHRSKIAAIADKM